jgi:hypothetical protein
MDIQELQLLKYATKIIDNKTGEELTFNEYTKPYVLCTDSRGLIIWLSYDRIDLK